jgi:hypothetical protein
MTSPALIIFLLILSAIGFLLSAIVSVATIFGINPMETIPSLWWLHVGMIVLFLPMLIFSKKLFSSPEAIWKQWPLWMKASVIFLAVYTLTNAYIADSMLKGGGPGIIDGQEVLHNHGAVIRKLTHEEYRMYECYETRAFAAWWVLGYGAETLALISIFKRQRSARASAVASAN